MKADYPGQEREKKDEYLHILIKSRIVAAKSCQQDTTRESPKGKKKWIEKIIRWIDFF